MIWFTPVHRLVGLLALMLTVCWPSWSHTASPDSLVRLASIRMGSTAKARDEMLTSWAQEVRLRTSIETAQETVVLRPGDKAIFNHPLLYWGGDRGLGKVSQRAVLQLKRHLATGGTLIFDNRGRAGPSHAFDRDVRHLVRRIGGRPLHRVRATHVVFRSFYRLNQPVGRRATAGYLEGLKTGSRYSVLYIKDDLGGAYLRSRSGAPALPAVPGGEPQREQAFRLSVNLTTYALCLDYKDDHSHVNHLLRYRRGRRLSPPPNQHGR